jgi:ethanolamine-phosphate cytidylyltransferase
MTSSSLLQKVGDTTFEKGPVVSCFLTTGRRLHEFCNNKIPKENDRVVYVDGAWDILHIGHIEILKKAKELGDFLFVGVHDDTTINQHRGKNYPILNLQERVFNLLALKYVDDVVIGAPWKINEDLVKSLKISVVAHGTQAKYDEDYSIKNESDDPYSVPKNMGIYHEILSEFDMNSEVLVKRIFEKREHYLKKYEKKSTSEKGYYENKEYLQEI